MPIKHAKQSDRTDKPNSSRVQPSDWNADHVVDLGFTLGNFTETLTVPNSNAITLEQLADVVQTLIAQLQGNSGGGEEPSETPVVASVGTIAYNSGTDELEVPLPPGVQENDILVAFISTDHGAGVWSLTGFTEANDSPQTYSGKPRLSVYWKRAGAGESNPTLTSTGSYQTAQMVAVRGCVTSGDPFDVTSGTANGSAQPNVAGNTTTVPNCLVLMGISQFSTSGTQGTAPYTAFLNDDLTNIEIHANHNNPDDPYYDALGIASGEKAAAGSYDTTAIGSPSTNRWGAWTGALKPQSGSGGGGSEEPEGTPVTWANLTNITQNGQQLEKTSGGNAWNGEATSNESFDGDFRVKFIVESAPGEILYSIENLAATVYASWWQQSGSPNWTYYFGSGNVGTSDAVTVGDEVELERIGSVVNFYLNGVLKGSSSETFTQTLYVRAYINTEGSTVGNVLIVT